MTKVMTLTQVAEYLGLKRQTIYNMLQDGRLPIDPIKGTNPRLWNKDDVDAWLVNK